MKFFEEEYKIDLLEINKRLKTEKNKNIIMELLQDEKYILSYLNKYKGEYEFKYTKKLNQEEVKCFLSFNLLQTEKINNIRLYSANNRKICDLAQEFIEKSKFDLYSIYKKMVKYNGIKIVDKKSKYCGYTRYLKSLDKNYILINKNNNINDYSTLIHELGHAKMNTICKDSSHKFEETYSVLLELLFADFLFKKGFVEEAYSLKSSLLKQVKQFFFELSDEYISYSFRNTNDSYDNYIFEYKYRVLRDIILAFYLYDLYLKNKDETLIRINYFILNSNKMTEYELLNIFKLNYGIFYNKEKIEEKLLSSIEKENKLLYKNKNRIIKK